MPQRPYPDRRRIAATRDALISEPASGILDTTSRIANDADLARSPLTAPHEHSSNDVLHPVFGPGHSFADVTVFAAHEARPMPAHSGHGPRVTAPMLQTKTIVQQPDDPLEREADNVARQVVDLDAGAPDPGLAEKQPGAAFTGRPVPVVGTVQRAADGSHDIPPDVTPIVETATRTGGKPLDAGTRRMMERGLGHDFSAVRVFSGDAAESSAAVLGARAYATGQNIVFGAGQYTPSTSQGRQLLAHELVHVVQQRAAHAPTTVVQRAPDGGAPTGAPPVPAPTTAPAATPAPAPAPAAPQPAATSSERAEVDAALASKDPGDVKKIRNVNAATADEKNKLIRILCYQSWVGPRDEYKIEELWRSYGDSVVQEASRDIVLWNHCIEAGAELMALPQIQKIKIDFMNDVRLLSLDYLKRNRAYIEQERAAYGIGSAAPTPEQANKLRLANEAAKDIRSALAIQQKLRHQIVGSTMSDIDDDGTFTGSVADQPVWFKMPFDPKRKPLKNIDGDTNNSDRDWIKVKEYWDPLERDVQTLTTRYPALYAAVAQSKGTFSSGADLDSPLGKIAAAPNPEAARAAIGEVLTTTLDNIGRAERKIPGNEPDYRDMVQIHAQLLGGLAFSLASKRLWTDQFSKWIVEQDMKDYQLRDQAERAGLTSAAMVVLLFTEIASAGAATFLWAALGATLTGTSFATNVSNWYELQNTAKTSLSSKIEIVDDATVAEALKRSIEDASMFLQTVATAGIKLAPLAKKPKVEPGPDAPAPGGTPHLAPGQKVWNLQNIEQMNSKSPEGQHALNVMRKYGVNVIYGSPNDTGSYYHAQSNTVVLSRYMSDREAAMTLVHEMGHAEWRHQGWSVSPRVRNIPKPDFVRGMITEEAQVQTRTISSKIQAQQASGQVIHAQTPLEREYINGYLGEAQKHINSGFSEAHTRTLAHAAGVQAVEHAFYNGTVVSSVQIPVNPANPAAGMVNAPYTHYYGRSWNMSNGVRGPDWP